MASLSPPVLSTTKTAASFRPSSRLRRSKYLPISVPRILCNAANGGGQNPPQGKMDRRDVLIGLGGLYGASALSQDSSFAFAAPVQTPNISKCGPPDLPRDAQKAVANKVPFGIGPALAAGNGPSSGRVKPAEIKFPITLESLIRTEVKRPKKSSKKEEEEMLVIWGIKYDPTKFMKFDVYINDVDDKEIRSNNTEFAGSFVNVPHKHDHKTEVKTELRLGITELLEDLEVDDDDSVVVTLIPRIGAGKVTVGGIKIEFDK